MNKFQATSLVIMNSVSIIREMSEKELWETPETLPEDLLADF